MQVVFFKCKIMKNNAFIKVLKRSRGDKFIIFVVGFSCCLAAACGFCLKCRGNMYYIAV